MINFIDKLKLKINRDSLAFRKKIFELKMGITGNIRPHSYPYISSDTFRFISDHVYDFANEESKIPNVKNKDIIFVNSDDIENYFIYIHPKIDNPYVLITHWGIKPVDYALTKYIDSKIIHWYGKNVLVEHKKITPLPIGLEDLHRYGTGVISYYSKQKNKNIPQRKNKILYHFKIATNLKERQVAFDYITKHPLAESFQYKLPPPLYLKKLNKYKFIISPPGAGEECHRTWEALYLNVIPIVKRSFTAEYFSSIGIPIWVVDDWHELNNIDEHFLKEKYEELINKKNKDALYMDYWIKKISRFSNKKHNELLSKLC